jgi:CheY-like chemotaxis protein
MKIILVVDDESGVTESLSALLSDEGYHVLTALNGHQGMEKLAGLNPDLVMLDLMMPIMDGPTMLQAIQSDPQYQDLAVVMMSSIDESIVARTCSGYAAFLRKPLEASSVLGTLSQLLEPRAT